MADDVLDLDFINSMLSLSLPPVTTAKAGWRLDYKSIISAVELLGLKRAVKVRFSSGGLKHAKATTTEKEHIDATFGTHRIKIDFDKDPPTFYHGLTISQILKFEYANEYLWHELRHCWQAEQVADKVGKALTIFHKVYKAADGEHGASYKDNRFEKDANAFAKKMVSEGKMLLIPKPTRTLSQAIADVEDIEEFITNHERLEDD